MTKPRRNRRSLAERMGIDTSRCELCDGELDDEDEWVEGMDGGRAHRSCLRRYL